MADTERNMTIGTTAEGRRCEALHPGALHATMITGEDHHPVGADTGVERITTIEALLTVAVTEAVITAGQTRVVLMNLSGR
jgi:hypothetical protein